MIDNASRPGFGALERAAADWRERLVRRRCGIGAALQAAAGHAGAPVPVRRPGFRAGKAHPAIDTKLTPTGEEAAFLGDLGRRLLAADSGFRRATESPPPDERR